MLDIDTAIKHCLEVAERYETRAKIIDRRKLGFALENPTACHECAADHRQLAEWLMELKEAKRLLKAAVEDFAVYGALKDLSAEQRVQNPDWRRFNRVFDVLDHQWRYADEALALIGEDTNVPAAATDINVGGKIDSWISVKDRLPDEDGWYLVCKHNRVRVAEWCKDCWYNESDLPIDDCAITYWQSLPEPPKDGDTNG